MTDEEILEFFDDNYSEDPIDETPESIDYIEEDQTETFSIDPEPEPQYFISKDMFKKLVDRFSIDDDCYIIDFYHASDHMFSFFVPCDKSEYIKVIDGTIYNFSSETITLSSIYNLPLNDEYYVNLEIPPYGSDSYYSLLADSKRASDDSWYYPPYIFHVVDTQSDGSVYTSDIALNSITENTAIFRERTSSVYNWSLSTIFIFAIFVILLVQVIFRKG